MSHGHVNTLHESGNMSHGHMKMSRIDAIALRESINLSHGHTNAL
jgi:hypothetical protein